MSFCEDLVEGYWFRNWRRAIVHGSGTGTSRTIALEEVPHQSHGQYAQTPDCRITVLEYA